MTSYDMYLRLNAEDMSFEFEGKVNLSMLEQLCSTVVAAGCSEKDKASTSTPRKKPKLTKRTAYQLLRQGKDYAYISQRFDCTPSQVAGYKSWVNRRGK
jgi:hypothetical protein